MNIRPVGAELSHADGQTQTQRRTDRHTDGRTDRPDEANSRFAQFCESASIKK
jgi:hypothetical protein